MLFIAFPAGKECLWGPSWGGLPEARTRRPPGATGAGRLPEEDGAKPPCSPASVSLSVQWGPWAALASRGSGEGSRGVGAKGAGDPGPLPGPREGDDGEREQGQGGRPRLTRPSRPGPWQEQVSALRSRSWGLPAAPPRPVPGSRPHLSRPRVTSWSSAGDGWQPRGPGGGCGHPRAPPQQQVPAAAPPAPAPPVSPVSPGRGPGRAGGGLAQQQQGCPLLRPRPSPLTPPLPPPPSLQSGSYRDDNVRQ